MSRKSNLAMYLFRNFAFSGRRPVIPPDYGQAPTVLEKEPRHRRKTADDG
jgi:hypothetical protein